MNARNTAIAIAFALALLGGAACGDDDAGSTDEAPATTETVPPEPDVTEPDVTEPDVTEPEITEPDVTEPNTTKPDATDTPVDGPESADDIQTADRFDLDLVACDQFAMVSPIASEAARQIVPDDVELFLRDDGMATITHVSKTCDDIVVDGTSVGPGHFDTQWIRIEGPAELRDVPEYAELDILETDYFYPVSFVTDNEEYSDAAQAFGIPLALADAMDMAPIAAGEWTGRVETADAGYEWVVDNANAVEMGLYFVHILERMDNGMDYRYEILCPAQVDWFGGEATLTLFGGSDLETALGPDLPGRGGAIRLTCDVTIDRSAG